MALAIGIASAASAASFDHVRTIQALNETDLARGQKLYTQHCVACHGVDGNLTQNPLARRFAADELKFGADPYALWKTISYGNGLMFRWDAVLGEAQRYQIVHYIRETYLRHNPGQYKKPDAAYFSELPTRADEDARAHGQSMPVIAPIPGMLDGRMGQAMRYGPAQSHSLAFEREENQNAVRSKGTTEKAMVVALPGDTALCYDTARLSVAGIFSDYLATKGIVCTASWAQDGGKTLPNIESVASADLLIVFARRMKLPEEQMKIVRAHWESGKPIIGLRTASHAWGDKGNADNLTFDLTVLGNNYQGHYGDEPVAVTSAPGQSAHPVLAGVQPFGSRKLYKAGPLAATTLALQFGDNGKGRHPVTLVNEYKGGRMFYTSLGVPEDFRDENFRRLLVNAVYWTTRRAPPGGSDVRTSPPANGRE